LIRQAIEQHHGRVFKTVGDAFCAVFATPLEALTAALAAQCALQTEAWPLPGGLQVRMALHTGMAEPRGDNYFGPPLNRVARLLAAAWGGQTLAPLPTQELVCASLPRGVGLLDLGTPPLRALIRPEHVFQVVGAALPASFPPLRTLDTL